MRYDIVTMNTINQYKKEVIYLESLHNIEGLNWYGGKYQNPKIFVKRLRFFLRLLGNPQRKIKNYIHIGGTSGKGSVANYIHNILWISGKKSGLFTSPFLTETIEKYKINDRLMNAKDFARIINKIKPALNICAEKSPYGVPSYFEACFTVAILYFLEQKCQYFVSEVGLGGEFDATNIVSRSKISIITHIDYDHMDQLGDTLEKIACTKSKIIKKRSIFLTAESRTPILKIFRQECKRQKTEFYKINGRVKNLEIKMNWEQFEYKGEKYRLKMFGEHQAKNAILAIEIAKKLKIKEGFIQKGLFSTKVPGRFEIVQEKPLVVLDGAHNPDKLKTVVETIGLFNYNKLHVICGFCANKDINKATKILSQYVDHVYITRFFVKERVCANPKKIKKYFRKYNSKIPMDIDLDPWNSLDIALKKAKNNDLVLITGSFFLVGELRKKWFNSHNILQKRKVI